MQKHNNDKWFSRQVEEILRHKKISLSPLARLVLLEFAHHCDREGNGIVSRSEIAVALGMAKNNISRFTRGFEQLKIMTKTKQFIRGSCGMKPNKFKIHLQVIINCSTDHLGEITIDPTPFVYARKAAVIDENDVDQILSPSITVMPPSHHGDAVKLRTKNLNKEQEPLDIGRLASADQNLPTPLDLPLDAFFEDFWASYPRKEKKAEARKIWIRERLDSIAGQIVEDVRQRQIRHDRWENRSFIPYPTTYLNGESWNDEIVERQKLSVNARNGKFDSAQWLVDGVKKDYEKQRGNAENIFNVSDYLSKKVD